MTLIELIKAVQAELNVAVDGKPGIQTWQAIYQRVAKAKKPIQWDISTDPMSEKNISKLHVKVQPYARALIVKAAEAGITIKITSGFRNIAKQNALYAIGRNGDKRAKVTNARGGQSNHNFAIAFDVTVFKSGKPDWNDIAKYKAVGVIGMDLGLEWGGNWKTIVDQPHFQLRPDWASGQTEKDMRTELMARTTDGRDYFA